jgi:hypothetical protein
LFRPRCRKRDPNLATVQDLAAEFETSLTATAIRFVEESNHLCTVVLSRDRVVEWAKSKEGPCGPRIEKRQSLSPDSLAYHCSVDECLSQWKEVPAAAWLEDADDAPKWEVMEQSVRFRGYPLVLTILCFTEKEDEADDAYDRFARWQQRRDKNQ